MPAALNLGARLAALLGEDPTENDWPDEVANLLEAATDPDTTPFGEAAHLDASPGAGTVLRVGASGKVDSLTLPLNFTGFRTFSFETKRIGQGTRIGKPVLVGNPRGDHVYFVLELHMRPAPAGSGGDDETPITVP